MLVETRAVPGTRIGRLWLDDFRCLERVALELGTGLTLFSGRNGQGKTSLLEAIGWVARTRSFRGVPDAALVRAGHAEAIVRAEVHTGERLQLFEAQIRATGRNRILCNKQTVVRARDLHGLVRVTVFAPDDLALVKAGPSARREYLDELLVMLAARYDAARADYERVLKHRNALLRSGVRDAEDRATLDVFDEQLVTAGTEIVRGRLLLIERLLPVLVQAYRALAEDEPTVAAVYEAEWCPRPLSPADAGHVETTLRDALVQRAQAERERGVTLVGPHRDEWRLHLGDLDARTQASQGEQRTLALAMRLAGHAVVTDLAGAAPILLLDDVFSELDTARAAALIRNLPGGQTLLTSAAPVPDAVRPDQCFVVAEGRVTPVAAT